MLRLERPAIHRVGEQHVVAQRLGRAPGCAHTTCSSSPWMPRSAPLKTSSIARPESRAPFMTSRSATPVQSAVPIASSSHGWLNGRGSSSARPLPAHSRVTAQGSRRKGLEARSSDSSSSCSTAPLTRQLPRSRVNRRDVEMGQQVVQAGWRDRIAQRLERHAPVARRQLQLFACQRPGGWFC